jgi:hypothetical protein
MAISINPKKLVWFDLSPDAFGEDRQVTIEYSNISFNTNIDIRLNGMQLKSINRVIDSAESVRFIITENCATLSQVENLFSGIRWKSAGQTQVLLIGQTVSSQNGVYTWTRNVSQPVRTASTPVDAVWGTLTWVKGAGTYRITQARDRFIYDEMSPNDVVAPRGDLDLDGWVTDRDAVLLERRIAGQEPDLFLGQSGQLRQIMADVNASGSISQTDANYIRAYSVINPTTGNPDLEVLPTVTLKGSRQSIINGTWTISGIGTATFSPNTNNGNDVGVTVTTGPNPPASPPPAPPPPTTTSGTIIMTVTMSVPASKEFALGNVRVTVGTETAQLDAIAYKQKTIPNWGKYTQLTESVLELNTQFAIAYSPVNTASDSKWINHRQIPTTPGFATDWLILNAIKKWDLTQTEYQDSVDWFASQISQISDTKKQSEWQSQLTAANRIEHLIALKIAILEWFDTSHVKIPLEFRVNADTAFSADQWIRLDWWSINPYEWDKLSWKWNAAYQIIQDWLTVAPASRLAQKTARLSQLQIAIDSVSDAQLVIAGLTPINTELDLTVWLQTQLQNWGFNPGSYWIWIPGIGQFPLIGSIEIQINQTLLLQAHLMKSGLAGPIYTQSHSIQWRPKFESRLAIWTDKTRLEIGESLKINWKWESESQLDRIQTLHTELIASNGDGKYQTLRPDWDWFPTRDDQSGSIWIPRVPNSFTMKWNAQLEGGSSVWDQLQVEVDRPVRSERPELAIDKETVAKFETVTITWNTSKMNLDSAWFLTFIDKETGSEMDTVWNDSGTPVENGITLIDSSLSEEVLSQYATRMGTFWTQVSEGWVQIKTPVSVRINLGNPDTRIASQVCNIEWPDAVSIQTLLHSTNAPIDKIKPDTEYRVTIDAESLPGNLPDRLLVTFGNQLVTIDTPTAQTDFRIKFFTD